MDGGQRLRYELVRALVSGRRYELIITANGKLQGIGFGCRAVLIPLPGAKGGERIPFGGWRLISGPGRVNGDIVFGNGCFVAGGFSYIWETESGKARRFPRIANVVPINRSTTRVIVESRGMAFRVDSSDELRTWQDTGGAEASEGYYSEMEYEHTEQDSGFYSAFLTDSADGEYVGERP